MPSTLTVAELLARIALARATPTVYLLGRGGYLADSAGPHDLVGEVISPSDAFDRMRTTNSEKYQAYDAAARAAGIDIHALPSMPACDCSGFVTWVLDMPRASTPRSSEWVYTDSIYAAAMTPPETSRLAVAQREGPRFRRDDSVAAPLETRVGAMLVFPAKEHDVGHIGFVTKVDASGKPVLVTHCSPQNFLLPPAQGAQRSAIQETAPDVFFQNSATIAVWSEKVVP